MHVDVLFFTVTEERLERQSPFVGTAGQNGQRPPS
jgi:hypothetical protein